jgi:imidazole glycerol-phosphate synthase subunit HisH
MIVIVDYGMGNLASIRNMLKKVGVQSEITSSPEVIEKASKIILPGVGAFDKAMENIHALDVLPILNRKVLQEKTPVLGICLGMQLLMEKSEEGSKPGLGWIPGDVRRFSFDQSDAKLKIPHMGWNLTQATNQNGIFKDLMNARFYFVHAYYVTCAEENNVLATTQYGIRFTSAVQSGNIFGTQFHPEKSHKFGMQLLRNFVSFTPHYA